MFNTFKSVLLSAKRDLIIGYNDAIRSKWFELEDAMEIIAMDVNEETTDAGLRKQLLPLCNAQAMLELVYVGDLQAGI